MPVAVSQPQSNSKALRDIPGQSPNADWHTAANRLAEDKDIGLEPMHRRVTAESSRDSVRLVEEKKRSGIAGQLTQRCVKSRLWQDHPAVGHHRLSEHAG